MALRQKAKLLAALTLPWWLFCSPSNRGAVLFVFHLTLTLFMIMTLPLCPYPKQSLASNGSQEVAKTESFGIPCLPSSAPLQAHKQRGSAVCPTLMTKPHPNPNQTPGPTGTLSAMGPKKKCQGPKACGSLTSPWQTFHSSPSAGATHFVLHRTLTLFLTLTLP